MKIGELIHETEVMKAKKSADWEERFSRERPLTIKTLEKRFADIPAGSTMLIVTPPMVDEVVRELSKGAIIEQTDVRKILSKKYKADYACPVTTGISLRVVAERAYAQLTAGVDNAEITPFWRVVAPKSDLAQQLSCGKEFISKRRTEEKV